MTVKNKIIFLLLCFGLSSSSLAGQDNPWYWLTVNDLKAMHHILEEDDPATAGFATNDFTAWFDSGLAKALDKAKKVNSYRGYQAVLSYYANGFNSEHLGVQFHSNDLNTQASQWPGFIVAMRNNQYQVVYRDPIQSKLPVLGAQLLNCDHHSPDDLMKQNIIPYSGIGYEKMKSTWSRYVPSLFYDRGNPWYVRPKNCVFQEDGHIKKYLLNWQPVPLNTTYSFSNDLAFGPIPDFGIHDFSKKSVWISLPTFQPESISMKNTLLKIIAQMSQVRNKDLIVFDLRGNGGGDASYSRALVHQLYGDAFIASLGSAHIWNSPWKIGLRVSTDNLHYWQAHNSFYADAIRAAMKQNKKMIFSELDIMPKSSVASIKNRANPVAAKIVLLTDGRCTSDCWLFVREMLQMPNTIQVGQPTHFMTRYTNANPVELPSHKAIFNVPVQIFMTPLNHFDEPFVPQYTYSGYMGDTDALQKWVLLKVTLVSSGRTI